MPYAPAAAIFRRMPTDIATPRTVDEPYEAPKLEVIGSVAELTLAGNKARTDDALSLKLSP